MNRPGGSPLPSHELPREMEKMMTTRSFRAPALPFGAVLVLAALGAACGKPPAGPPQGPAEVGVVTLAAEKVVLTTELPGRTSAFLVAEVRPQVNGLLRESQRQENKKTQGKSLALLIVL